jgi:hypothetical protein
MRFIEDFSNQQQKPFLPQTTRVDTFLADEIDLQAFLDIALS